VPLDIACVVGCGVLTGVGSVVNRARVQPGETAAVFGIGGIGLNVLQGLRLTGASHIIAVDLLPSREEKAREFGATDFIDASGGDTAQRIKDIVSGGHPDHGSGVDWAFECVGNVRVLNDAMASLGWGGNCVIVGTTAAGTTAELSLSPLSFVDRGVMGARYGAARPHRDIPSYIAQYRQGKLMLDELVTQRYDLADFERAFHDLEEGRLARGVFVL
jgi:S-(hydroxymethyl)glutathione dehydrogenase/alcohol dehydrogenase